MKIFFANKLIETFPQMQNSVEEYLASFPDVYLHLIFGDVFMPYLFELLRAPYLSEKELMKAGTLVELMANSDEYVQEVVVTTILEPISDEPKSLLIFERYAGSQTRCFIKHIRAWGQEKTGDGSPS